MDQCPLCESFVLVTPEKPCALCGLSLVEIANDKTVAMVPGWFLLDPAKPRFAESVPSRLLRVTENVMLDLSEMRFLSSAGVQFLIALHTAVQETGLKLVFANVGSDVREVLRVCRLSRVFRMVGSVEDGLDVFSLL